MRTLIEQLHYTWTPRGVEGINRFQIAAMSSGFRSGGLGALLPVVRKICRYDPPRSAPGQRPTSFGWFDYRGYRIGFLRVGLPPARGKVGNFAAHILVGAPSGLRESELASTFGSPFWWTGNTAEELDAIAAGRRDFELPAVDFDDVVATRVEADPADLAPGRALAHALLTLPAEGRLAVTGGDAAFGGALRTIAGQVPEALDGLSLSTYEGAPTFPFKVVGGAKATPRQRVCSLDWPDGVDGGSQRTLERLVSWDGRHEPLRAAARRAAARVSDGGRQALWRTAESLVAVASGDAVDDAVEAGVCADPDAIAYLASSTPGRATVAGLVQAGAAGVRAAVRSGSARMPAGDRSALYDVIAERYVASSNLEGCAAAADAMAERAPRDALFDSALRSAISDRAAANTLGAEDAAAILSHAARRGFQVENVRGLLRATARHVVRCAAERDIPDAFVGDMWSGALMSSGDPAAVADALVLRPSLLPALALGDAERDRCVEVLGALTRERLQAALPILLPWIADERRAARLTTVIRRLPELVAGRCLAWGARRCEGASSEAMSRLCDDHAAVLLGQARSSAGMYRREAHAVALELLQSSGSMAHPLAEQLLNGSGWSGRAAIDAGRQATRLTHPGLRWCLAVRALDCASRDIHRLGDVAEIWGELCAMHRGATEGEILRLLLEHASHEQSAMSSARLLGWIADGLLPAYPKLVTGLGHLRDRRAEEMAQQLAGQTPGWCFDEVDALVRPSHWRARAWWRTVTARR